jgi:hypothetical protein
MAKDDDGALDRAIDGLETAQAYCRDHGLPHDFSGALAQLKARRAQKSPSPAAAPSGTVEDEMSERWSEVPTRRDKL